MTAKTMAATTKPSKKAKVATSKAKTEATSIATRPVDVPRFKPKPEPKRPIKTEAKVTNIIQLALFALAVLLLSTAISTQVIMWQMNEQLYTRATSSNNIATIEQSFEQANATVPSQAQIIQTITAIINARMTTGEDYICSVDAGAQNDAQAELNCQIYTGINKAESLANAKNYIKQIANTRNTALLTALLCLFLFSYVLHDNYIRKLRQVGQAVSNSALKERKTPTLTQSKAPSQRKRATAVQAKTSVQSKQAKTKDTKTQDTKTQGRKTSTQRKQK